VSIGRLAAVVAAVVGVVAVSAFVWRLDQVVGYVLASVALAVLTLPVLRTMTAWVGRPVALVANAVGTVVVGLGLVVVSLRELDAQLGRVADLVEQRLDRVDAGSLVDRVITSLRLGDALDQWLGQVPSQVVVGEEGGTGIAARLFSFLLVVVLATFLQASGATIVDWIVARWPRETPADDDDVEASCPSPRLVVRRLLDDVERRGVGLVRRSLVLAALAATAVAMVARIGDVPGAVVLGLWAGAWFVVPTIGSAVGLAPLALLAGLDGRPAAYVALGVAAVVALATTITRRRWCDRLVRLGVGPWTVSLAVGTAVAGLGGSAVCVVAVAAVAAALTSPHRPCVPTRWEVPVAGSRTIAGLTIPTGWRGVALATGCSAAAVLLWILLDRLGTAVVWLAIATFVAVALSRPISWLERRTPLGRKGVTALVVAVILGVVLGTATTGADDGAEATSALTTRLPEVVAEMESLPVLGGWLEARQASSWVDQQMNDLPARLRTDRPADWLPYVGERLLDLFWTALLAVALLVDGPRLVAAVGRRVPARHRRQHGRLVAAVGAALAGYAAGAALVAAINGAVVFAIAVVLGIGLAPALALWAFVWNFVPQIGGFMGGLPLVVFALVIGPGHGVLAAALFIAYQFVENHLIQPTVIGAAVDIAPWGTLLTAVAGGAAAGVVGAVVLTPLVGVALAARREYQRQDFPGTTVRRPVAPTASAGD
jgi:predicted PurR-regulated permease PerM